MVALHEEARSLLEGDEHLDQVRANLGVLDHDEHAVHVHFVALQFNHSGELELIRLYQRLEQSDPVLARKGVERAFVADAIVLREDVDYQRLVGERGGRRENASGVLIEGVEEVLRLVKHVQRARCSRVAAGTYVQKRGGRVLGGEGLQLDGLDALGARAEGVLRSGRAYLALLIPVKALVVSVVHMP